MSDIAESNKKLSFNCKFIPHSNAEIDIHGLDVTDDGEMLVCDVNNRCILKYSPTGQCELKCKVEHYPRDIVVIQNQAVVTLQEARFSRKPGFIAFIDIAEMGIRKEILCQCTPFGITHLGDSIAVGSWNIIQLYDFEGVLVKTLNLPEESVAVKYIKPGPCDSLVYVSSTLNCVSKEGDNVFNVHMDNGTPRGLCVSHENFIYVSNSKGQLMRYSEKGELVDILINGEKEYAPITTICFSKDCSQLYVATHDGSSLSVFDFK